MLIIKETLTHSVIYNPFLLQSVQTTRFIQNLLIIIIPLKYIISNLMLNSHDIFLFTYSIQFRLTNCYIQLSLWNSFDQLIKFNLFRFTAFDKTFVINVYCLTRISNCFDKFSLSTSLTNFMFNSQLFLIHWHCLGDFKSAKTSSEILNFRFVTFDQSHL